ncbi:hypothetical protein LX36DRAFT_675054 [Colletotrichum falcatum]|nr:hypothetical protein LX36DRAFT_675054 [Colletotrichum falcatum]
MAVWASLDTGERVLQVFSLIHQLETLVLEVVWIFISVTIRATCALVIISFFITLALWLYGKYKPAQVVPVESWRNDRAGRFLDNLKDRPLNACEWNMDPNSSTPGRDTAIKLIGTAQDRSKCIGPLQRISVNPSAVKDQGSTLFNLSKDDAMTKKKRGSSLELSNIDFEMAAELRPKLNAACLPTGASLITVTSSSMTVQVKPPAVVHPNSTTMVATGGGLGPLMPPAAKAPKFSVIDVVSGTALTFVMSELISPPPEQNHKGYSLVITEKYVDTNGYNSESIEIEQVSKKHYLLYTFKDYDAFAK